MATSGNWENVVRGKLFEEYVEKLTDWSQGRMLIQLYDNGALGDDLQILEGVRSGTLNIINCVPSYLSPAVPEAALLDIPALFGGPEAFNAMMDAGYQEVMQEYFSQNGLYLLSCRAFDMRQMTSNVPVQEPADLEGLQLRTMETEYHVAFWRALGALPIPMSFNQVWVALQLGSIQGQENPLYYLESARLSEVQDYVVLTNHLPMISCYVMNLDQWEALAPQYQQLLQRFMDEMEAELLEETQAQNQEILAFSREQGLEILEISESLRGLMQEAREVVVQMLREDLGDETVDQYLAAVNQALGGS